MSNEISLRVMGFARMDGVYLLCLDTDIAVHADSVEEAKRKMIDALRSYFDTFTADEMAQGVFVRYSPLRYRTMWRVAMFVRFLRNLIQTFTTTYDPHSGQMKFA